MATFLKILRLNEPRAHMAALAAVFAGIGFTLWFQPGRYDNTPSYANLLQVFHQPVWAAIYLAAAFLNVLAIWRYSSRVLVTVAHTVGISLVSVWLLAFVVRYLTDDGTTLVNVLSWSTFLYLSIRSALMVDDHVRKDGR